MTTQVSDSRLVTYAAPAKHPGTEKSLRVKKKVLRMMTIFIWCLTPVALGYMLVFTYPLPSPLSALISALVCCAVGGLGGLCLFRSDKYDQLRERLYGEVLQGRIISTFAVAGARSGMTYYVRIEGHNRMNQLTTRVHWVNPQKWRDGMFVVGEYYDFTNEPWD